LGATPEEQLRSVLQEIRRQGGEWSYIKVIPLQQATVEPGRVSVEQRRSLTPEQKAAGEKAASERAVLIKQGDEWTIAFNTAMTALEAKRYDEAVASFAKLSEADSKQAVVWVNLGAAYFGLAGTKAGPEFAATTQKGLDAYAKVVALKPDDVGARRIYAGALAKAKRFPEMQAELKKCADLDPANAYQAHYSIGAMLTNAGENDAAAEAFRMAIAAAPDEPKNAEAYFQYGIALVGKAQVGAEGKVIPAPGTVEAFQKYLQLAPDGPNAPNAKNMITTLGSTIEVKSAEPKRKKN
jgi:tetratricopeptide (TPR) repeat protein